MKIKSNITRKTNIELTEFELTEALSDYLKKKGVEDYDCHISYIIEQISHNNTWIAKITLNNYNKSSNLMINKNAELAAKLEPKKPLNTQNYS